MEEDLTATRIPIGSAAGDCFSAGYDVTERTVASDLPTTPDQCFDRPARWAAWLKCEAALAMAEAEIGIIPMVRENASTHACPPTSPSISGPIFPRRMMCVTLLRRRPAS